MDATELTGQLKLEAQRLGFGHAGACRADGPQPEALRRLDEWLEAGYAGEMHYLSDRRRAYDHPRHVLDGVRSILMLAMPYRTHAPRPAGPGQGMVSRYAWGSGDYHDLIHDRLRRLQAVLATLVPGARSRGIVDTAPLDERRTARAAGLGWIGKNTLLLNRESGSWFFLAALLTDAVLDYDAPFEADHCGTCRACLDACPTSAFPQPYVLDATRCISYLTIELRSAMPRELRAGAGSWLFGCDVCQDVCPWNGHAPLSDETVFEPHPDANPMELAELFFMDDARFRDRFRATPLWRPRRAGLLRNAAVVLGNRPAPQALAALVRGLGDHDPIVRGACAWALGHYGPAGREALEARRQLETDACVLDEIEAATQVAT